MDTEHDWTLLPAVVVRSAGFPWELVQSLVHPRAAEAAAAVVRLERRALDLLAEAPGRGTDARPSAAPTGRAGSGRLRRGLRSRLRDLRPLPDGAPGPAGWLTAWNDVTGRLEEARLTLAGLVSGDAALGRAAVAGIVADERFLDALVGSSPALYRDLRHGAKGGKTRRELAEQVQRLSASCETAGCYGPVNYGAVAAGQRGGYTWAGAGECSRRVAFPAARVGEALQQRVLAEPALVAGLVPRRKTWTGEVLDGAAFVGHCDGGRTLAEIAAATGTGVERSAAALAVAVRRGLLTHDLCPPATVCDTLGWLRERLIARGVRVASGARDGGAAAGGGELAVDPGAAGRGRAAAPGSCECGGAEVEGRTRRGRAGGGEAGGGEAGGDESDGARARRMPAPGGPGRAFAARAGVPAQRVRAIIGARPAQDADLPLGRRVGEISELLAQYPGASPDVKLAVQRRIEALAGGGSRDDRAIVHEAAAGTLHVTVGDRLAADLRGRVPRVLDLLAEEAELTRQRTNRLLAGRLGPGTYELAEVLRSTGDLEIEHGDRLAARIAALVCEAPADATELNLAGLLGEPAPPAAPVLCSADVMVAAPALEAYETGVTPLVLSRLHDAVLLTPWALQFHEEGAACLAERDSGIRRALSGFTVLNVISRRSNGVPPLELPGPVLELGGVAADPRRRRIGLDELYVHSDGQRAVLHAKGMEEPLLLHNGEHDTALHTAFALPRVRLPRLGELARVPRLTWDNVVVSRRRWRLGRSSFDALGQAGSDRELLVAMARLREVHELPVAFFASTPRERRSLYVDTRSPALLEGLARLAACAELVTVTEVLPGPEGCWLREGERRYAAELRCVYLRPAGSSAPGGHVTQSGAAQAGGPRSGAGQARAGSRPGAVSRTGPGQQASRAARQPNRFVQQFYGPVQQLHGPVQQSHGSAQRIQQPHGLVVQQPLGPVQQSHPYPWPGESG
ncbi:hypothetical protein HD597_002315 [Nonomuraea thailandensis]|uniref:Lantibiotic dehydratase N-terminal domain-containing protein n=1 Tax=Nonomuraea thailandensis TaxID=1188745 RepID=A0A9X2GCT9_9ACTN|nr:lantibiotic dehydratase family protein [Nonomuraea thailandensis]MCP2355295.1 hypothetical protein [Nonomuraea thailandensis]